MLRVILVALFLLSGCAATPKPTIPPGYTGGVAQINDTFERLSRSKANIYYVKQLNGNALPNVLTATKATSEGSLLIAQGASRDVPSESLTLTLVGQVHHSAPIGYALGGKSNYKVEGDIRFTPQANAIYLVKGDLRQDYAAVWLEDIHGNLVSDRVVAGEITNEEPSPANIITPSTENASRSELFLKISGGETADLVKQKIGDPDEVVSRKRNLFIQIPAHTLFHYHDLGDVKFSHGADDQLFVEEVIPKAGKTSDDVEVVRAQLATKEGTTLQNIAESYFQHTGISQPILDLFAQKVWEERQTDNPYVIDAVSWLCKTLAKSNNPRYRDLLKNTAQEAKSKKLRRYALTSWKQLPEETVVQFKP